MELVTKKNLILVAGRGHPELSTEVAQHLHLPLGDVELSTFANGEIYCRYGENIRGADVFVFQSHADQINDRLMEQLIMIDAAKRASAKRITAVSPFYGYSRQDRKAEGREPITARLVADMFTAAGADRVVTVDLHTGQIQGFFNFPVDHLTAVPVLVEYLAREIPSGPVTIVAPDAGGGKLARRFADRLKNSRVREVVVTNTVPVSDDKLFDSLRVLSIAPLLANAIRAVFEDRSVSELFGGDNV
jgi:ribose-phosphate pyrophosphokinase